jgi:hypothetical protein
VAQGATGCGADRVEISLLAGDRPLPRFDFGLELTYRWSDYGWYTRDLSTGDYGFTVFDDGSIRRGLHARGEYEYLSCEHPLDAGAGRRPGA